MKINVVLIVFSLIVLIGLCHNLGDNLWYDPAGAVFFSVILISVCIQVVYIMKKCHS